MVRGSFPTPKLPQYLGHADEENVPTSPSLSPLVPDSPQLGISTGLPRLVMPYGTSLVPPLGVRLFNSFSPLLPAHVSSSISPLSTQATSPPHAPFAAPAPSTDPGRKVPLLSSVACKPPLTYSPPPGMGGRPCRLSFWYWSTGPPYQTGLQGY